MDLLKHYLMVDYINLEHLLDTGEMKVARNPGKEFAIVPFDTHVLYG